MTSSGMKRGLAATAVSALAVTGLPFLTAPANADSLESQYAANTVALLSQYSDHASVKNDGQNTMVHLVAAGGSGVQQIRFEYKKLTDLTYTTIATVARNNGVFSAEWAPAVALYGENVEIRAVGLNNAGGEIAGAGTASKPSVNISAATNSVDITNAAGSSIGMFPQPYTGANNKTLAVVSGTTSDVSANPTITLEELSDSTAGDAITVKKADLGEPADGVRSFKGLVDLSGYPLDTTAPIVNEVVVGAKAGSDDAETLSVYKQVISTVTAAAATNRVPSGETADVVVTVLDQNNKPIAGAEVVGDDDVANPKYTDVNGKAVFPADGTAAGKTHSYHVNTTGSPAYEAASDFRRDVTISTYAATAQSITAVASKLGSAVDNDEYAANPVSLLVKDQNDNPVANKSVQYTWAVALFDDKAAQPAPQSGTVTTDNKGVANIPQPTLGDGTYTLTSYVEGDGTPGRTAGDLQSAPLTVKIGEADVVFADNKVKQAQSGTTTTVQGALQLADGSVLGGREIALGWTPAGDAIVAPQSAQPAGTTRTSNNGATTKTGDNGSFAVALVDPAANPAVNEKGGQLTATPNGNADAASTITVDFLKSAAPVDEGDIVIDTANLIGAMATPGRPVDLDITILNETGDKLTDFPVEVSVDKGFLSPNAEAEKDLTPEPAPAEGGLYGEWKSVGTSKTLNTDDDGVTGIVAAIEKDAGFDTAEVVTLTVTVRAGNVTKTVPLTFSSKDPLNPGGVKVELDDKQSVGVLPKAPTTETVAYNVFAMDQFGNPVAGEPVKISDGSSPAKLNDSTGTVDVMSQLKNADPVVKASSQGATSQVVKGEWTQGTKTFTDAVADVAGVPATQGFQAKDPVTGNYKFKTDDKKVSDSAAAIDWYGVDFATSTFELGHSGAATQKVGDTVRVTYKAVDQNGEPIQGLSVRFFRTGPDELQDGEGNGGGITNGDGVATYIFQGAKAGKGVIDTIVSDKDGNVLDNASRRITVTFESATTPPPVVTPVDPGTAIQVANKRNGNDVVRVTNVRQAAGAMVRLFKVRNNGTMKLVGKKAANAAGNARFVVLDKNDRKATNYVAKVGKTEQSLTGESGGQIR